MDHYGFNNLRKHHQLNINIKNSRILTPLEQTQKDFIKKVASSTEPPSLQRQNHSGSPQNTNIVLPQLFNQKRKTVFRKHLSAKEIFFRKLDFKNLENDIFRECAQISANLISLMKYINNKRVTSKYINIHHKRITFKATENFPVIQQFLFNQESQELKEPITQQEFIKRIRDQSQSLYEQLIQLQRLTQQNSQLSLAQLFLYELTNVSQQIAELYQVKIEEKMSIMTGSIISEWEKIYDLRVKLPNNDVFEDKYQYQYEKMPNLRETDRLDAIEQSLGCLGHISQQQRRYNRHLYQILSKVRSKNDIHKLQNLNNTT